MAPVELAQAQLVTISRRGFRAIALPVFGLLSLFAIAIGRGVNVDEHQFIASAALLAREGALPYPDYPFFHTPYLCFVYAVAFLASDHLLFSARLLSVVSTWSTLLLQGCLPWSLSSLLIQSFAILVGPPGKEPPEIIWRAPCER